MIMTKKKNDDEKKKKKMDIRRNENKVWIMD